MAKTKFNVLDVVIVLVILAIVCVGGYVFMKQRGGTSVSGQQTKLHFTVEVTNISKSMAEAFHVGDSVVFGTTNSDRGVIYDVKIEPYRKLTNNIEDGSHSLQVVEGQYTALVTIETMVQESDEAYINATEELAIGLKMPINAKGAAAPGGFIVGMEEVE